MAGLQATPRARVAVHHWSDVDCPCCTFARLQEGYANVDFDVVSTGLSIWIPKSTERITACPCTASERGSEQALEYVRLRPATRPSKCATKVLESAKATGAKGSRPTERVWVEALLLRRRTVLVVCFSLLWVAQYLKRTVRTRRAGRDNGMLTSYADWISRNLSFAAGSLLVSG